MRNDEFLDMNMSEEAKRRIDTAKKEFAVNGLSFVMREAWRRARIIAAVLGQSVKSVFAMQLKSVWADVKA